MPIQLSPATLTDQEKDQFFYKYKIDLKPAPWNVKIFVTDGFQVSEDGENFSQEIKVEPNLGLKPPRINKTIFVRNTNPSITGGTIRHTQQGSGEEDVILTIGHTAPPPPPPPPPPPLLPPVSKRSLPWLPIAIGAVVLLLLLFFLLHRNNSTTPETIQKQDSPAAPTKDSSGAKRPDSTNSQTTTPANTGNQPTHPNPQTSSPPAQTPKQNTHKSPGKNKKTQPSDNPTDDREHKY